MQVANEFYNGYTPSFKVKPLVCIFLKRIVVDSCALNNLVSVKKTQNGVNSTYGKKSRITLGFNIYCATPKCDKVFTEIASLLMLDEDVGTEEINCLSIEYQPLQKAYLLQGELVISKLITVTKLDDCLSGFKLAINNKEIREVT